MRTASASSSVVTEVMASTMEQQASNSDKDIILSEQRQHESGCTSVHIPEYMIAEISTAHQPVPEQIKGKAELVAPELKQPLPVVVDRLEVEVEGTTYEVRGNRLYLQSGYGDKVTRYLVSGLIAVVAVARDINSSNWGRIVRFEDLDGNLKQIFISNKDITTSGQAVINLLSKEGLLISTQRGMTDALLHFLNLSPPMDKEKAVCADRIGWHGNLYLFHDNSFIGTSTNRLVYTGAPIGKRNTTSGNVVEWRENVGVYCRGNSLLILGVCVSLASVLLRPLRIDSCGYHIFGESSTGKSTSAYVAASVHGDPDEIIGSWNTTVAGMEGRAKKFTDALLINDELHESNAKDTGKIIYMIMNGKGRQRSNASGDARDLAEWRLNCLSSGEVSSEDFIKSNGGNPRAGHAVRMLDVSADMGTGLGAFETIHGAKDSHSFAEQIKKASQLYHGSPIRTFLEMFIGSKDRIEERFEAMKARFFDEFVPEGADGQVKRVATKVAAAVMAGEMATAMGITGWEANEAFQSVGQTFSKWLSNRGTIGQQEPEKAVDQVKSFLRCHGMSRFMPITKRSNGGYSLDGPERTINNMAGFRVANDNDTNEFIVFPHVFTGEMCQGLNSSTVTRTLVDRELIFTEEDKEKKIKPQVRRRIPGYDLARYYHFKASVLSDATETEETETEG